MLSLAVSPLWAGDVFRDLLSNQPAVRQGALAHIYEMDSAAKKKLIEKINSSLEKKEPVNHVYLFEALGRLGPEAIPVLAQGLTDPDYKARSLTAEELGKKGPQASSVVSYLIPLLKDPSFPVRINTIRSLGKIAIPPGQIETALLPLLNDGDEGIRSETIDALGALGPSAEKSPPALEKLLKKDTWRIQWKAAKALGDIGPAAKSAVTALIQSLYSEKDIVQNQSRLALVKIGPPAVPALKKELKTKHDRVREDVRKTLKEIGTPEAFEALESAAK